MILELRDNQKYYSQLKNSNMEKQNYNFIKVTNPDNPRQSIYVREDYYNEMMQSEQGLSFSFKNLWTKAKALVTKVVGTIKGAAGGGGGGGGGFEIPIIGGGGGQPNITLNVPSPPAPAMYAAEDKVIGYYNKKEKDNTMIYILGAAALVGGVVLFKK